MRSSGRASVILLLFTDMSSFAETIVTHDIKAKDQTENSSSHPSNLISILPRKRSKYINNE